MRRRQGPINTAAVTQPRLRQAGGGKNSATSASWWRSTPRQCRRPASQTGGEFSPMAAATDRHRGDRLRPRSRGARRGAKSCSPRWTATAQRGYDVALTAPSDAVTVPVIASGGVGNLDTWSRHPRTATRPPCSPPRSSFRRVTVRQAKDYGESRTADALDP